NPIDWEFIELNPAHERHTGLINEELIGKRISEVYPDIESRWLDFYGKVALTGKPGRMEEYNKNTGKYYEVNSFCTTIGYFATVFTDISDRRLVQQKLTEAKEKAEAADNLKTAFLNNISHEVRTPLNGIMGFAELYTQPDNSEAEKANYMEILEQSTERLLQTITDYMDISLLTSNNQTVNLKKIEPAEIIRNTAHKYVGLCRKKSLEFSMILPENADELIIETDKELLKKILNHLLDNAVKFTITGEITCGFTMNDEHITIFVTDTGVGIAAGMREAVFENFVQENASVHRPYEGSGLGLSIVKNIASLLGYDLHIDSIKNAGTSVYLTLPLHKTLSPAEPPQILKPFAQTPKKTLILIAEDDPYSLSLLENIMFLLNIDFIVALNGKQAVDLVEKHKDITLVLMDVKMPDMDGLKATRIIKNLRPKLPIIAQTAHALAGDQQKTLEAGCDDYLSKPIHKSELVNMLKKFGIRIPG
ncbi:MAG: response regulator, partial [Bacteroidales bacterium]|nr:response regulator [Bacteroidales bacterium]